VDDCRGQHVVLFTKDRQLSKYQQEGSLRRLSPNEFEFNVRIWKAGGSCYAFLLLSAQETNTHVVTPDRNDKVYNLIIMLHFHLNCMIIIFNNSNMKQ